MIKFLIISVLAVTVGAFERTEEMLREFRLIDDERRLDYLAQEVDRSHVTGESVFTFFLGDFHRVDPDIGYFNKSNQAVRIVKRTSKQIIFDILLSTDEHGRRKNIKQYDNQDSIALLWGCSFTFGAGLNDDETINYYFNEKSKTHYMYNYGLGGSGANSMLGFFESRELVDELPPAKTTAFYVYIDSHVERTNGFLQQREWLDITPYYEKEDNILTRKGSFRSGEPYLTKFYDFLRKDLKFLSIFNRNFPPVQQRHYDYFCDVIKKAEEELRSKVKNSKLVFYYHPSAEQKEEINTCLKERGVEILKSKVDLHKDQHQDPKYWIPYDGHPNGKVNILVAQELNEYLADENEK